jgi:hypothetical protein
MRSPSRVGTLILVLTVIATNGAACYAQEKAEPSVAGHKTSNAQSPPPEVEKPSAPQPNPDAQQDENPKRILGIIPNFQTTNDTPQAQAPLTVKEKYVLAFHQTVDFSAHVGNAFQAVLQQASNGQPHYGQGWGPYAQRFGAAEADQATSSFFIFGFLPHVLKDDPRYFRKAKGSPWTRIYYAASRTVIARTDLGNPTFNAAQVLGQLAQQGISTAYYSKQDRSVSGVFHNWGINLAYNSAYNVLKEYYPDALRLVLHRHRKPAASSPTSAQPGSETPAAVPSNPKAFYLATGDKTRTA